MDDDSTIPDRALQNVFLDLACESNFEEVKDMLREHPALINVHPDDRWTALHQAAYAGNLQVVSDLLRRGADCSLRCQGQTAAEVAKTAYIKDRLQSGAVAKTFDLRPYDQKFVFRVRLSTLIGLHDEHLRVTGDTGRIIAAGVQREQQSVAQRAANLRGQNLHTEAQNVETGSDIVERFIAEIGQSGANIPRLVINIWTQETWIYNAINLAEWERDRSVMGLALLTRTLHDMLCNPPPELRRVTEKCWRWMRLDDDVVRQKYTLNRRGNLANLISFPGFTAASYNSNATWRNLRSFQMSNVLLVITSEQGQEPIDIAPFSDFPNECEALWSLGQMFEIQSCEEWEYSQYSVELGSGSSAFDDGKKWVIQMKACDRFHACIQDMFRDGNALQLAVPIVEARLQKERESSHGDVVQALYSLGGIKLHAGDVSGALRAHNEALSLLEREGKLHCEIAALVYKDIGMAHRQSGNFEGAMAASMQALTILHEIGLGTSVRAALVLLEIGHVKVQLGELTTALQAAQDAKKMFQQAAGTLQAAQGCQIMMLSGSVKLAMNDHQGAIADYEKARQMYESTGTWISPQAPEVLPSTASTKCVQGETAEAFETSAEAKQMQESMGSLHGKEGGIIMYSLGNAKRLAGDLPGALRDLLEAKEIFESIGCLHAFPDVLNMLEIICTNLASCGHDDFSHVERNGHFHCDNKTRILEVFRRCDLDGHGVIKPAEFKFLLQVLDSSYWTDENIDTLFAQIDTNDDGKIDTEELVAWLDGRPGDKLFEILQCS